MNIVKVKTHHGTKIFINLDRIDYISFDYNDVYFSNRCVTLDDESMKKVVKLLNKGVNE